MSSKCSYALAQAIDFMKQVLEIAARGEEMVVVCHDMEEVEEEVVEDGAACSPAQAVALGCR